jgi:ADP-ribose pyrophosphatase YjhB (NUDIX family)
VFFFAAVSAGTIPASVVSPNHLRGAMSQRRYPERPFVAVGTIVVRDGCVLLARRGKEPSYGLWSLPGGAVDLGEGLKVAAARETREECGIEIEITDVLEVVERMVRDPDGRVQFHYVIVDYLARWTSGELVSSSEVLEARWVPPEDFLKYEMTRGTAEVVLRMLDTGRKAGVL